MLKQSTTNADIKFVRSLQQKKFRQESGLFVVEGKKMVAELLNSDFEIVSIFSSDENFIGKSGDFQIGRTASPDASGSLETRASGVVNIYQTKDADLERMSSLTTSPGVLAVVRQKTREPLSKLSGLTLVLDGISDPGNMGTIIRTAEWFGVEQILCPENCVELYNPKVVQATMGSLFRMPVVYGALPEMLKNYLASGIKLFAATMDGKPVNAIEKSLPALLAIGSESNGLSNELLALASTQISIPGKGKAESLNAAVAAGILMQAMLWK